MKNPLSILLVEDNEGDVLLTTLAFEEAKINFKLSVANDGKEAIDLLDSIDKQTGDGKPELIFLDINLPKKNGHEILKFIKSVDILAEIPVVMLTTSSSKMDIDSANEMGIRAFITKPSDINEFFAVIADVVHELFPGAEK
jgi:CheY-like chemotaxis protein